MTYPPTDLVKRLRCLILNVHAYPHSHDVPRLAADEIERLQREVTRLSALVRCGEAWMDRELDRQSDSIAEGKP